MLANEMPDVGARVCDSQQLRAIDDFDSLGSVVKIRAAAGRRPALHSQVPHPWLSCESENGAKNLFAPSAQREPRYQSIGRTPFATGISLECFSRNFVCFRAVT